MAAGTDGRCMTTPRSPENRFRVPRRSGQKTEGLFSDAVFFHLPRPANWYSVAAKMRGILRISCKNGALARGLHDGDPLPKIPPSTFFLFTYASGKTGTLPIAHL